jgi:hypothetical protein
MTIKNPTNAILDTETDTCLFRAPRDIKGQAYQRGRDLYFHQSKNISPVYYLHRWSRKKREEQRLTVISNIMASRFLEERGLVCPDAGDQRAAVILRNWGYGILEEF